MARLNKAQGMPLNVIIIAVIALLVLIVLVFIFTGKSTLFKKGVESCEGKGGICKDTESECIGIGPVIGRIPDISCDRDNDGKINENTDGVFCCLKLN
jgi:hypothetical protein